jgi:hypothetical protein
MNANIRFPVDPGSLLRLAEAFGWDYPPTDVIPAQDEPELAWLVAGSWLVVVTRTVSRDQDESWTLVVGHDDNGRPLSAFLRFDGFEIGHDGWGKLCQLAAGPVIHEIEEEDRHIHLLASVAPVGRAIDAGAMIAAIRAEYERRTVLGKFDDWTGAVAALIAQRQRPFPADALAAIAAAATEIWGGRDFYNRGWLAQPSVWEKARASVDHQAEVPVVEVRFAGVLDEPGVPDHVADDIAGYFEREFARRVDVRVFDSETGLRGRSGAAA